LGQGEGGEESCLALTARVGIKRELADLFPNGSVSTRNIWRSPKVSAERL
jgi:hypothetical protein